MFWIYIQVLHTNRRTQINFGIFIWEVLLEKIEIKKVIEHTKSIEHRKMSGFVSHHFSLPSFSTECFFFFYYLILSWRKTIGVTFRLYLFYSVRLFVLCIRKWHHFCFRLICSSISRYPAKCLRLHLSTAKKIYWEIINYDICEK